MCSICFITELKHKNLSFLTIRLSSEASRLHPVQQWAYMVLWKVETRQIAKKTHNWALTDYAVHCHIHNLDRS